MISLKSAQLRPSRSAFCQCQCYYYGRRGVVVHQHARGLPSCCRRSKDSCRCSESWGQHHSRIGLHRPTPRVCPGTYRSVTAMMRAHHMLRRSEANGRQTDNKARDLYFTDLFACLAGVARANSVHCLTSYVVRLAFRIDDRKRRISAGADGQTLVPQHGERVRECFRVV